MKLSNGNIENYQRTEITGSDKGKLVPTEVGIIVTDFLVNNFKNILDYNFTASVEQDFDKIANGDKNWTNILKEFYGTFHPNVEDVKENAERESGERLLGVDPVSGRKVIVRLGKFGPMVQIGKDYYEDLTPPKLLNILEEFENDSDVGIVLKNPYIYHNDMYTELKGYYLLESGEENILDVEEHVKKYGDYH